MMSKIPKERIDGKWKVLVIDVKNKVLSSKRLMLVRRKMK